MFYDPATIGYTILFMVIMCLLLLLPLLLDDSQSDHRYSSSSSYRASYEHTRYIYRFPNGRVYVRDEE